MTIVPPFHVRNLIALIIAPATLLMISTCSVHAQGATEPRSVPAINAGPGIQICEPIADGSDTAIADFGSGCSLWLQWVMGFHPELGQTPRFELTVRPMHEMNLSRLRLLPSQAVKLHGMLGATHVATAHISGAESACTLTYQLYIVPSLTPVGKPIKLSGSRQQILTQLPGAAISLLSSVGVNTRHVPEKVNLLPEQMVTIGHYDYFNLNHAVDPLQPKMDELAKNVPLAALLVFLQNAMRGAKPDESSARSLIEISHGNFLVFGAIGTFIGRPSDTFKNYADTRAAELHAPNNAVLAFWAATQTRTISESVNAWEKLVQLAPNSSTCWKFLAKRLTDLADSRRLGRVAAAVSAPEFEQLDSIYQKSLHAAEKAVGLDPEYEDAWYELSIAGTFAGAHERADAAFWKAYTLDKSDVRLYNWGLEMYQTKWGGDPDTLAKVAHLAVSAPYKPNADIYSVAKELKSAGFASEAQGMFARAVVQARDLVRQQPESASAHSTLGYYLYEQRQLEEARSELETAVKLDPNSDAGHLQLGNVFYSLGRFTDAIIQYKESLRISNSVPAKTGLATAYADSGQFDEAEKLFRELIKAQPNAYASHERLGWVLLKKHQTDAAIEQYQEALRISPNSGMAHRGLGGVYFDLKRYDEALEEGLLALRFLPADYFTYELVAFSYVNKDKFEDAIPYFRRAIEIEPKKTIPRFQLGNALIKVGKKAEGRAELKRFIEMETDKDQIQLAQELLNKNP